MEPFQRDHIKNNLPQLQYLTDCHVSFIAILVSKNVLGDYDAECLRAIENRYEKAAKFYEIVLDRENSYEILREALRETVQTGAEAILNNIESSSATASSSNVTLPHLGSRMRKRIRYEVRSPVHLFTGREAEISFLHEHLTSQVNETTSTTIVTQAASVTGLGGIGKTELCRKYIELHSEYYDGNVIWIQAEHEAEMTRDFKIVAKDHLKISLKDVDGTEKDIKTSVDEVYKYFEGKRALFVFDNVVCSEDENLDSFLPTRVTTNPAILITSRDREWRELSRKIITIGELNEVEAVEFVKKGLKIENISQDEVIKKLVNRLQYFPLAIQQAVSFIRERGILRTFEISEYLSLFETNTRQLLKAKIGKLANNKYSETTFTTWKITTDLIASEEEFGELSIKCLHIMSYFQPDRISIELFSKSDRIPNDSPFDVESALQLLVKYSMINSQPAVKMLSVHRLVQEVTRINLKDDGKEEQVLSSCLSIFLLGVDEEEIGHAKFVVEFSSSSTSLLKTFPLVPCNVGETLMWMGSKDGPIFFRKWHKILNELLPEGSIEIIHFEFYFAHQLYKERNYEECLEAFQLVLGKYMTIQGLKYNQFMVWRTNRFIAETLKDLGKYKESVELAETCFTHQLDIPRNNNYEPICTACVVFSNYLKLGDFKGVLDWVEMMLDVFYDDESLSTPVEQHEVFNGLSESERKSRYLEKIVNRVTKLMELDDLWTMFGMELATYLETEGNDGDSVQITQVIYELSIKLYGEEDPKTLAVLVNIARLKVHVGEYEQALSIFRQPILVPIIQEVDSRMGKQLMGSAFAKALSKTGEYEEALRKLFQILDEYRESFGAESEHFVCGLYNIASVHVDQEQFEEALGILVEAQSIANQLQNIDEEVIESVRNSISQLSSIVYPNDSD